jgi:hypothetical protein
MTSDSKAFCADLIFADVVQDLAAELGISRQEVRRAVINSPAYEALYDFDTELWKTGPDYFGSKYVMPYLTQAQNAEGVTG